MLLKAYTEALAIKMDEAVSTTGLATRAAWLVIRGTDAAPIAADSYLVNVSDTTRVLTVPFLDGSTVATDPNRMKQIETIQIRNTDNISHVVRIGVDTGSQVYYWTFTLAAGSSLSYGKEYGWQHRNAAGTLQ